MKNRLDVIKPAVRGLRAYSLSPHRARVKINQNENPWDTPPALREEIFERFQAAKWSRYPDFIPATLHERLAEFAGLSEKDQAALAHLQWFWENMSAFNKLLSTQPQTLAYALLDSPAGQLA